MTSTATAPVPVVGLSACIKDVGGFDYHAVFWPYVEAVLQAAEAQPLIVPAIGARAHAAEILGAVDGIVLTGSSSNVQPHHYAGPASRNGVEHDPARDATTLPLIRAAIAAEVPVLAICRGFQELNVALGGTLHQHVEEVSGRMDHRSDKKLPHDERYGPRHAVRLTAGGQLHRLLGKERITVNSLHGQGIDSLAAPLRIEALAEDGTIEAVSMPDARGFVMAVQWHPEHRVMENRDSLAMFRAFGDAARQRNAIRLGAKAPTAGTRKNTERQTA